MKTEYAYLHNMHDLLGMDDSQIEKFLESYGVSVMGRGKNKFVLFGELLVAQIKHKDAEEFASIDFSNCKKFRM